MYIYTHNKPFTPNITFTQVIRQAEEHLRVVTRERDYYRQVCKDSRDLLKAIFSKDGTFYPPPATLNYAAMSLDCVVHYSFDMAQQVCNLTVLTYNVVIYFITGPLP